MSSPQFYEQYAQDPLMGFSERYPKTIRHKPENSQAAFVKTFVEDTDKPTITRKAIKRSFCSTYVACREPSENIVKLIKISIVDVSNPVKSKVLVKAQYPVKNDVITNSILDDAETLVNKISKTVCGYSANLYM